MPIHPEPSHDALFTNFQKKANCKITVVIPVKDEEKSIEACLASLEHQLDSEGKKIPYAFYEVLILANNCTDQTVTKLIDFQNKHLDFQLLFEDIQLHPDHSNIGYVRKLLMDIACRRQFAAKNAYILTTDGDTEVSPRWISSHLSIFKTKVDAVGGRIFLKQGELESMLPGSRKFHLLDEEYQLKAAAYKSYLLQEKHDLPPSHHQHFNGSFGITAYQYARTGGLPDVKFLEDCAFYERMLCYDTKICHSHDVQVFTSGRSAGRATFGLATQIQQWGQMGKIKEPYKVNSPEKIKALCLSKNILREFWEGKINEKEVIIKFENNLGKWSSRLRLHGDSFRSSYYFGTSMNQFEHENMHEFEKKYPKVPIEIALKKLRKISNI